MGQNDVDPFLIRNAIGWVSQREGIQAFKWGLCLNIHRKNISRDTRDMNKVLNVLLKAMSRCMVNMKTWMKKRKSDAMRFGSE